jgi:translation initiation factor eIF-2B subunit alpha
MFENFKNILTHSKSRVVLEILKEAHNRSGNFHVFVCESFPNKSGSNMVKELEKIGVNCTLILDAAVGAVN